MRCGRVVRTSLRRAGMNGSSPAGNALCESVSTPARRALARSAAGQAYRVRSVRACALKSARRSWCEPFKHPPRNLDMDSFNGPPLDPASAVELVARVISDIDASDDEHRDVLLSDLLSAAWGNAVAQKQRLPEQHRFPRSGDAFVTPHEHCVEGTGATKLRPATQSDSSCTKVHEL